VEFLAAGGVDKRSRLDRLLFWRGWMGRRASFALEFAMVGPVFFLLLFTAFEISYDLLCQEVLNNALQYCARQVQVGNAQTASSSSFVSTYFCPFDGGVLNCNNVFIRVEEVSFTDTNATTANGCTDYYDATTGGAPVVNGVLQLGLYYSGAGTQGQGSNTGNTKCDTATGFVDPPAQACVLMSAVYVAPSFLGGLVLNRTKYNGQYVRPLFSSAAFVTEPFNTLGSTLSC